MKVCAAIHHGPSSAGMARHLAPFRKRQMIASRVRRRLVSSRPVWGLTASIKGSITLHCLALRTGMASLPRCSENGDDVLREDTQTGAEPAFQRTLTGPRARRGFTFQ